MTKQEQIYKYFNENDGLEKEKLIKGVSKKFNIAESTATTHYYAWKRKFTGSNNCVPKEEKKIEKPKPKEKQKIKIPHDTKPINVSKEEIFKKPKITIIDGKVDYNGKEFHIKDGALVVGEERFKNINELEEYKKRQLKEFYMQISEIADVLDMIN